jgi:hypothetical protein
MLGRPLAFASHHFDTQLPSYCDPAIDKSGRLFAPNVALFRLAYILGDIMDDAVSVRPVPYESVQANDRALTQWMDGLPVELDLDEYRMARSLASPNTAVRRVGVQSVVVRASFYHIRFSLHRPYASSPTGLPGGKQIDSLKAAQSLEIAVSAADKLITIVTQSRPDFLANSALAVPGHMSWGPFHAFSAAMFFSFHLIAHPEQPGAGLFRQCIRKATALLEQARGNSVAEKGYDILQALSPLYTIDFPAMSQEAREKQRQQVLSVVRKLAFPLHDSRDSRRTGESPSDRVSSNSNSVSPPLGMMSAIPSQQYESLHTMSTVRTTPGYPRSAQLTASQTLVTSPTTYQPQSPYALPHQPHGYDNTQYAHYVHPVDEASMWGASIGFGEGEWSQFLDNLQPAPAPGVRHIQGPQ